MSAKQWIKVNGETFRSHIELFRESGEVRSKNVEGTVVHFTGDKHTDSEDWIGKTDISGSQPLFYISVSGE